MNRIFYALLMLATFTACAESSYESFHIQGSSAVSSLDGRKFYLGILNVDSLAASDSCEVVHGEFSFTGKLDSVAHIGYIFYDRLELPLVIERGDIQVIIDRAGFGRVSGSPLNEMLNSYREKMQQLANSYEDLGPRRARMQLEDFDEQTIQKSIMDEAERIEKQLDSLQEGFVTANMDNVLGPFAFGQMAHGIFLRFGYPMLTDPMKNILQKAPDAFKNHPFVSDYLKAAQDFLKSHENAD